MKDFPVVVRFPVHWGELDALGHVNNARYFTWFESARMALFEKVGLANVGSPTLGPILAHTACDFLAPVRFPAELVSGARIERLGSTSFTMAHGIALADEPDQLVAKGQGVVVLIDYVGGGSTAIPAELRGQLEGYT